MSDTHRKFAFDTVFDGQGDIASAPAPTRRSYRTDEVERIHAQAFAEGESSATARAQAEAAAALNVIAQAMGQALGALAQVAHEHRAGCAELALAVGRTMAGAALERFPEAPAAAALQALAQEIEATPRLVVRAASDLAPRLQASLDATAQACGFGGQIVVKADLTAPPAAFVFDWGDGRAGFDPNDAAERVAQALRNALAAEGLHAEPLVPPALTARKV